MSLIRELRAAVALLREPGYEERVAVQRLLSSAADALEANQVHLNSPSALPPVECPLLILLDGKLVPAWRPGFVENRGDDIEYRLGSGETVCGHFAWTYP